MRGPSDVASRFIRATNRKRRERKNAPVSACARDDPGCGPRSRTDKRGSCAARHGLVPYRRPAHRDHRPADQGGRVHARRRARQDRPERQIPGRADVRAVLPAAEPQGQAAAAAVAWRRPDRRDLRDQARRRRGLAQLFHPQGLGHLHLRRGRARPLRLDQHVQGRSGVPAVRRSVGALPHRPDRLVERRPGQARDLSGHAVPDRGLRRSS